MSEKRRFRRITYRRPLGLEQASFEDFRGTAGRDLSAGGVRIRSEQFMPLGSPVRVQIQLGDRDVVILSGKVIWVQKEPCGDYYQIGVDFPDEDSNLFPKKRIMDFAGGHN